VIDRHLAQEIVSPPSLKKLAAAAGLSIHHFIRAYHHSVGQTPHAHLLTRRIELSLELLLKEDARVNAIADAMGFSSPSHFVMTFRRHMGVTPGALHDASRQRS
jgi:AraC family transcriptional regulator